MRECFKITSVDLSGLGSVTSIGNNLLYYCSEITSLDLSCLGSVTSIGYDFLGECSNITSLDLSGLSSVTSIGDYFLYTCERITWDHDTCLLAAVPDDFDRGRQDGVKDKRCQHHQHQPPHPEHPHTGCFLSKKERNKLAHALNGNGGTRKDSRDRRPRDDTRDRDEDRTDKEERRLAKLEKEKLESLDEIEEEKQRLGQQRMAMEQHHHQKETNLQGQEKQLEQQRQHQQQELQSQYHQQQQQLQSHHQLKETESLQKEQNLQAQLKEQHQHQQKELEKQYHQRQQQLESQQQKKDAESEQQAHLTRSQLQKEKESFQTEKERLHLQLDQQLKNEKEHLHRKLKEQIGQEKVQQQQKLQQKEEEIQRREEEVNRGQHQLHQQQQQLEQQQQQSQHQQLELQQQRQQQQQQHQQLELEQQQLQQQLQLQQHRQPQQQPQQQPVHYMQHQPYATYDTYAQQQQSSHYEGLQQELKREREEKSELREMLRNLQQQLDGLREELKAQHAEAKRQQETAGREAREMQERFLLELEAERVQIRGLNSLREEEEEHQMDTTPDQEANTEVKQTPPVKLPQDGMRELDASRKKLMKEINEGQVAGRSAIQEQMVREAGRLAQTQKSWENAARKERSRVDNLSLAPEYWPEGMAITKEQYDAGAKGVHLTTREEARKRMSGTPPGAWETLSLVTLEPPSDTAQKVQVVLKETTSDGEKRILKQLWMTTLGRVVVPSGTDVVRTESTREMVVRVDKKWSGEKRWSEVKRSPIRATEELRKMPGYVDTYNPRIGDQSVTVMLRVKVAEVKNFLRESGKDGVFTKEKDPREERAVKAAVIWLPKDETLGIARDKAVEVDGGLGLVVNEHGLGLRVTSWQETAAREKLHLPAKLPETKITGIPIGTTTDEAIKWLTTKEGWEVRKTKEGVRNGMRWMVVRGPVRTQETITVDGVLCMVEAGKQKVEVDPKRKETKRPNATPTKPEKRRDPTEGTGGKWYTRLEFIEFHGKKKGQRLWLEASNPTPTTTAPTKAATATTTAEKEPKSTKKKENSSVDERLDRLERLLMAFMERN